MVNYKKHPSYLAYLNGGTRPDERLLPRLATNIDGRPFINPGEVYCRYTIAPDQMCSQTAKFSSESALRSHYRKAHQIILEERRPGRLKRQTEDDMIRWYSALGANLEHNWTPRKANIRGRSPQPEAPPSLMSITRVGEPTPIFGPSIPISHVPLSNELVSDSDLSDSSQHLGPGNRPTARRLFDDEHNSTPAPLSPVPSSPAASPPASEPLGVLSPADIPSFNGLDWCSQFDAFDQHLSDNESDNRATSSVDDHGTEENATTLPNEMELSIPINVNWDEIEFLLPVPFNKVNLPAISQMRRNYGFTTGKQKCDHCAAVEQNCPAPRQYDPECSIWSLYENPFQQEFFSS